jgi:hypothetical protein
MGLIYLYLDGWPEEEVTVKKADRQTHFKFVASTPTQNEIFFPATQVLSRLSSSSYNLLLSKFPSTKEQVTFEIEFQSNLMLFLEVTFPRCLAHK